MFDACMPSRRVRRPDGPTATLSAGLVLDRGFDEAREQRMRRAHDLISSSSKSRYSPTTVAARLALSR